jgi:broad specificity phosphatase PhoE
MLCAFITHPEVVIDPSVRIEDWGLSPAGQARAERLPNLLTSPVRVVSSTERKALNTADIVGSAWGAGVSVDPELGEMDRSATGYLESSEFESTVDLFFANPYESARGWERAIDAQHRIERVVRRQAGRRPDEAIAFIAHGGVGALLLASLTRVTITRGLDQPGMGSHFTFDAGTWQANSSWQRIT